MVARIQNNFTSGELDPLVIDRLDLKQWVNGAQRLRNCIVIPQGGFTRCFGTRYLDELENTISRVSTGITPTSVYGEYSTNVVANSNDGNTNTFFTVDLQVANEIEANDPWVLVHFDLGSAKTIYFADVDKLRLIGVDHDVASDFFIQYSTDNVAWTSLGAALPLNRPGAGLSIVQTDQAAAPTSRRRQGPVTARYWRVARVGTFDYDNTWAELAGFNLWERTTTLSAARLIDFQFSADQQYALVLTDYNAAVYADGVLTANIATPFSSAQLSGLSWTQSLDTLIVTHEDVQPFAIQRQGADDEWNGEQITLSAIPLYAFSLSKSRPGFTLTPSAVTGNITLTTGAAFWATSHVGQIVDGNFGRARIIEYTSTTVVKAFVLVPFFNTTAIGTGDWVLETGYEAIWSDTRGWPRAPIFYQNRLALAGAKSLPNSVALSRSGEYFDFDLGQALDDDAILAIIQADDVPTVYAMKVDRHLQIFTSSAEYYVPIGSDEPVTPRNIAVRRTTARGIKPNVRPVNISGATIFLQRGGKAFREFVFLDTEAAYTANNLSLLSSHLISDPVAATFRRSTNTEEGDLLIAVNDDGTLALCVTMRDQEVTAWTPRSTDGLFKDAVAIDTDIYFIVDRVIGGVTRRYLEVADFDILYDCAVAYGAAGPTLTGLDHLDGKTVKVRADDATLSDEVVSSGQITADRAIANSGHVGLPFDIDVETLPAVTEGFQGARIDGKKRISRVMLSLFETQHLRVNSQPVTFRQFGPAGGGSPLDAPPPIFTGHKVVDGLNGWDDEVSITITQDEPAPITVRALEYQLRG